MNRYLGSIEANELSEVYPSGSGRQIAIDVYSKFRPADDVVAFSGKQQPLRQSMARSCGTRMLETATSTTMLERASKLVLSGSAAGFGHMLPFAKGSSRTSHLAAFVFCGC
ncbi:hypothetical protein [Variovorax sp. UC122_21]|uniref:hypothetical protein n=1 Tax=Variovorax sp. UC122_21 TaxID=3374554 RepID=UPI00375718DC